jgi:hypothetical protein
MSIKKFGSWRAVDDRAAIRREAVARQDLCIPGSHVPMLSQPEAVAKFIANAAAAIDG